MVPLNFSDMRAALQTISDAIGEGYLVSCSWDGSLLRVSIGQPVGPHEWRRPWVMTFNMEADYSADPTKLIADLAHGAKAWFGSSKDQADEIERLLKLAEEK